MAAEPVTLPLKPQLRFSLPNRRFRLLTRISSGPTNVVLQSKPPHHKTQQKLSAAPPLRRPNRQPRPELSEDGTSVSCYSDCGNDLPCDVLRLMDALELPLDEELYLSLIEECTDARDAGQAALVHAHILNSCRGPLPLRLANRLMLMYAACSDIENARKVFGRMPVRDTLSWAVLISAYSDLPDGHYVAMKLFAKMLRQHPIIGEYLLHAIICTLRSCARSGNIGLGLQIHALMIKQIGLPDAYFGNLGSALVQFYCSVEWCDAALQVFDEMRSSCLETTGLSTWSSVITSCNQDGRFEEAVLLFKQMAMSGKRRESKSLSCALAASAEVGTNGSPGRQIHADAIKHGLGSEPFVVASLVHMYSHQGLLTEAARSFEAIERPDEVCWNAMLVGYTRHGLLNEAVKVLYRMREAGVHPTEHMINEVKLACTN